MKVSKRGLKNKLERKLKMYKSPIEIIIDGLNGMIRHKLDEECLESVYKAGIIVDKDELIKALKYDREQYEKGYKDCINERVKFLEKQLDIAIKELCFTAKGADACNSLDNLYEGIKEWIEEQARKEVQE